MKFKLKKDAGRHVGEDDGKVYEGGDIIETHQDLGKLFPEKFELVEADPPMPAFDPNEEVRIPVAKTVPTPALKKTPSPKKKAVVVGDEFED